jgi:hypothetical protein
MTKNRKIYLRSLGIATAIEAVVLFFTLIPMMEGFMHHSAAARAQSPILSQFLNCFGIMFHMPSIILAFWCPPLVPIVQVFLLSGLFYLRSKMFGKYSDGNVFINFSEKDEISRKYWL